MIQSQASPIVHEEPEWHVGATVRDGPFSRILIPIDGSERSMVGAGIGVAIAKLSGGRVTFLTSLPDTSRCATDVKYLKKVEATVNSTVNTCKTISRDHGVRGNALIVKTTESIPNDILSHSNYDIIVMFSQGRYGVSRLLLGSVTESVMYKSKIPILIVRWRDETIPSTSSLSKQVFECDEIIVNIDSNSALRSTNHAIILAKLFPACSIRLLYVSSMFSTVDMSSVLSECESMGLISNIAVNRVEVLVKQEDISSTVVRHLTLDAKNFNMIVICTVSDFGFHLAVDVLRTTSTPLFCFK